MDISIPVVAGSTSTVIFAVSTLPMLIKAGRSKNMSSYSWGNIVLANIGNAVHSVYIFSLPFGPIWVLHIFYLVSMGLMLLWYLRYEKARGERRAASQPHDALRVPDELPAAAEQP